jgi:hypothetical protein
MAVSVQTADRFSGGTDVGRCTVGVKRGTGEERCTEVVDSG